MNNEEFQKITHATNNINSNLLPEMTQITADHGWGKSSTVAEGYIENFLENKKETSRKIFGLGNQLQAQPSTS
jgi:hypothetical protein